MPSMMPLIMRVTGGSIKMKNVDILIYNKKGGQGKTTLSVEYCKLFNAKLLTNDTNNFTQESYQLDVYSIPPDFPANEIELATDRPNVFDFGGYYDNRINAIAAAVDICIVPLFYQSDNDIKVAQETMHTLQENNKNCIFVINNTQKEYHHVLKEHLSNFAKTFIIPRSEYISKYDKTVYELYRSGTPQQIGQIKKILLPYYEDLFNYINKGK